MENEIESLEVLAFRDENTYENLEKTTE
jgi:hypothetical protein